MVAGHFAGGSLVSKAVHLPLWVDGAMGFVLLSGIVLGIVRRKQIDRGGTIVAVGRASARRAAELWGILVTVHVVTFVLRAIIDPGGTLPAVAQLGSAAELAVDIGTLQVSLRYIDILTFYIFFLLAVPALVAVLRRRFGSIDALLLGLGVYLADMISPLNLLRTDFVWVQDTIVQQDPLFAAPRWFALFVIGLVLGWNWTEVHKFIGRPGVRRAVLLTAGAFVLVARAGGRSFFPDVPDWAVDKFDLGPLAISGTVLVVLALFVLLDPVESTLGAVTFFERPMRFLDTLGRSSLAAYVIHVVVLFAFDLALGHPFGTPIGVLAGALSLCLAWVWATTPWRRVPVHVAVVEESESQLVASR